MARRLTLVRVLYDIGTGEQVPAVDTNTISASVLATRLNDTHVRLPADAEVQPYEALV
jgi:hypothetical protein